MPDRPWTLTYKHDDSVNPPCCLWYANRLDDVENWIGSSGPHGGLNDAKVFSYSFASQITALDFYNEKLHPEYGDSLTILTPKGQS